MSDIYIREITLEDTPLVVKWRNNPNVKKNFIYQGTFSEEGHERWLATMVETGIVDQMIICQKENDTPIGSVFVRDIDHDHNKGEYGIFIGEDEARGRGYGTAAALLMIEYEFKEKHLHKLFLRVLADNTGAIKSYEKAGFVKEAYLKDDVRINGVYKDIILMAIINEG